MGKHALFINMGIHYLLTISNSSAVAINSFHTMTITTQKVLSSYEPISHPFMKFTTDELYYMVRQSNKC